MRRPALISLLLVVACQPEPTDAPSTDDSDAHPADTDPAAETDGTADTDAAPQGCLDVDAVEELPIAPESAFIPQDTSVDGKVAGCTAAFHAFAGAGESVLEVHLEAWGASVPARVGVFDLLGNALSIGDAMVAGDAFPVTLPRSGETLIRVAPGEVLPDDVAYTVRVTCVEGCDLAYTRYPIVLMHGPIAGGKGSPVDNWRDVVEALEGAGYAAFSPSADLFDTPAKRAPSWQAALSDLQREGYGRKFNLVAHSQGGIDARYLVGALGEGDRVASITTVATPHLGNPLADVALGLLDVTGGGDIAEVVTEVFGTLFGQSGQDLTGTLESMTVDTMTRFNADVPDDPAVAYFSWTAKSCSAIDVFCKQALGGEAVATLLEPTQGVLRILQGENDGVVPTARGVWGRHLGTVQADHMEQIGQVPDHRSPVFDQATFFLSEAERLAVSGF